MKPTKFKLQMLKPRVTTLSTDRQAQGPPVPTASKKPFQLLEQIK